MKKPSSFKNNPFGSLKSLKTGNRSVKNEPSPPPRKTEGESDDANLFVREMEEFTSLGSAPSKKRPQQTAEPEKSSPASGADDERLFLKAMKAMGTRLKDENPRHEDDGRKQQSSVGRMRQLKRGMIRISEELDLHSHRKAEALRRLALFIAGAYRRGRQAVLVITGKGNNSLEGPVLQVAVADWLRNQGRGMVAEFAQAPQKLGGRGAFIVFLRGRDGDNV